MRCISLKNVQRFPPNSHSSHRNTAPTPSLHIPSPTLPVSSHPLPYLLYNTLPSTSIPSIQSLPDFLSPLALIVCRSHPLYSPHYNLLVISSSLHDRSLFVNAMPTLYTHRILTSQLFLPRSMTVPSSLMPCQLSVSFTSPARVSYSNINPQSTSRAKLKMSTDRHVEFLDSQQFAIYFS